ncbi:MAG TPA: methyltransferase domain-containing protein [Solirubrobacteraceae bacterium]|nr:methyltransferase domain-containing protein [Solirubrobacteraceae bacterium]
MGMQWGAAGDFPSVYEELMVPAFFGFYAADLIARAGLREGDRLLDVACGTGVVPRAAAATGVPLARLTGLDMTPGMLAVAARVAGDTGAEWIEGDATAMPFEDASFDVLTCQQGFQFLPDREAGAREFRRVLAPGGRALVACWTALTDQTAHQAYMAAIAPHEPDLAGVGAAPFTFDDGDLLAGLLEGAGFAAVEVVRVEYIARFASAAEFVRSFSEGSPLALALATMPPGRDAELREAALPALAPFEDDTGLAAAMATHVAIAVA